MRHLTLLNISLILIALFNNMSETQVGGPVWDGDLASEPFCEKLLKTIKTRLNSSECSQYKPDVALEMAYTKVRELGAEIGALPFYFSIGWLREHLSMAFSGISLRGALAILKEAGYIATRSHADCMVSPSAERLTRIK